MQTGTAPQPAPHHGHPRPSLGLIVPVEQALVRCDDKLLSIALQASVGGKRDRLLIPVEIVLMILSHYHDPKELILLARVSRCWYLCVFVRLWSNIRIKSHKGLSRLLVATRNLNRLYEFHRRQYQLQESKNVIHCSPDDAIASATGAITGPLAQRGDTALTVSLHPTALRHAVGSEESTESPTTPTHDFGAVAFVAGQSPIKEIEIEVEAESAQPMPWGKASQPSSALPSQKPTKQSVLVWIKSIIPCDSAVHDTEDDTRPYDRSRDLQERTRGPVPPPAAGIAAKDGQSIKWLRRVFPFLDLKDRRYLKIITKMSWRNAYPQQYVKEINFSDYEFPMIGGRDSFFGLLSKLMGELPHYYSIVMPAAPITKPHSLYQRATGLVNLDLHCAEIRSTKQLILALSAHCPNLKRVVFPDSLCIDKQLEPSDFANLAIQCPLLRSIRVLGNKSRLHVRSSLLPHLFENCRNLENVTLKNLCCFDIDRILSSIVVHNANIRHLHIECRFSNIANEQIEASTVYTPHLKFLQLTPINVSDAVLARVVQHCQNLNYLNLSGSNSLTDAGVDLVSRELKFIKRLDLTKCFRVTAKALESLALHAKRLQTLILYHTFDFISFSEVHGALYAIIDHCPAIYGIALTISSEYGLDLKHEWDAMSCIAHSHYVCPCFSLMSFHFYFKGRESLRRWKIVSMDMPDKPSLFVQ
ncbi:uncharacterized protein BJ171DRAFT_516865 [Polychytrium aggregatum]|uniref:uncharacterized protein n=1 Tax=Polychytrium aggregatum TaxID=110093 RepID=UPI0022FDB5E1|nr:uncharacterized protein BJ171DRAFT_516865 [Polychytrium aggregatum]KAI9201904.1 hypothetical protein BJ171DRAFT_516865 [Polychytrium aggregatum]